MNTHCHPFSDTVRPITRGERRPAAAAGRRLCAFSLLEILGVLAVTAILLLALLPSLLKDLTTKFHDSEAASLTTIINGLRNYVSDTAGFRARPRSLRISPSNWAGWCLR